MSARWCVGLDRGLELCEILVIDLQPLGSRSPRVAIAVLKGGTPAMVGEPVARESAGLHQRCADPHAFFARVGHWCPRGLSP